MTRLVVRGGSRPLAGDAAVPGDPAIGDLALLLAAIAEGPSTVGGTGEGDDRRRTLAALTAFGVAFTVEEGAITVAGVGAGGLRAPAAPIDCGGSERLIYLLCGLLAGQRFPSVLTGDRWLESRPMARVAGPLAAMGAIVDGRRRRGELCAPLEIAPAAALRGIDFRSPSPSAEVKSALLLAGLSATTATAITEPAPSIDHAERMLRALGAPITVEGSRVTLDPRGWDRRLLPRDLVVPGDLSAAAALLCAAFVVPGSAIAIRGVGLNPTRTGILDLFQAMGADFTVEKPREVGGEPVADLIARGSSLTAIEVAGERTRRALDDLPLVAALAASARGTTVIRDAAPLRARQSDRLAALAAMLRALAIPVDERPDGLAITGAPARGADLATRGDPRIAGAAVVAALAATGDSAIDCAAHFSEFPSTLARLGAEIATG